MRASRFSAAWMRGEWRREWRAALDDSFGLDLRSLALFRIVFAAVLLYDLFVRWGNLEAHYTDAGVLPRAILPGYPNVLSYHALLTGAAAGEAVLFGIAMLFAVLLLVGYRTHAATIASWVLLMSVQGRNSLILTGGDAVMRLALFWGMFLPLGAVWSIDSRRVPSKFRPVSNRLLTMGTAAYVLQLCFLYCFSVYFKSDPAWHREGTAIYDVLSLDQFATAAGKWLLDLRRPGLLTFLTHLVVLFETFGPILMLLPWRLGPLRTLLVFAFLGFHTGLGVCLHLGTFPWVCCAAWLALLPSWFWDPAAARVRRCLQGRPAGGDPDPATPLKPPSTRMTKGARWSVRRVWLGDSALCQATAAFLLIYVLLWNLRTVGNSTARLLLRHADGSGQVTGLYQRWDMFGPRPYSEDGWHVVAARLADGSSVDLMRNGAPLTWDKPPLVTALYKDEHWRKFLDYLRYPDYASFRPYYIAYIVRNWNQRHSAGQQVRSVEFYFIEEDVRPDYAPRFYRPVLLWRS